MVVAKRCPQIRDKPASHPEPAVLDTLEEFSRVLNAVQSDILSLVTEAYFRGATWTDIARRLDRSKQAVHQRFQRRVHATRTHELLLSDLAAAAGRAREICRDGAVDDVARDSLAFLRRQIDVRRALSGG